MWSAQDSGESRLAAFGDGFKIIQADATEVAMAPLRIVKRFDVVENIVIAIMEPFADRHIRTS